jgi:cell division septation protein DedD
MTSVNLLIPDLTWRKLGEWGKIALPEVGTFTLESTPAQLDLVKNTIISSEEKISYFQDAPIDSRFDIREANIARDWMEENYTLFLHHFRNSLSQEGTYFFKHIGTLTKTSSGIKFSPDPESALIQRGKELQQIAFTPIERIYVKPEADARQNHSAKPRKKYSVSKLTLMALFVVINTALIFWLVEKKRNSAEMDSLSVSLPDNRLNVKPSADAPLPDVPEIRKDSLSSMDSAVADMDSSVAKDQEPKIKAPAEIIAIPFFEKPGLPVKPIVSDSKPEITTPAEQAENKADQEKLSNKVPQEKSLAGKCAIIVGSFKEKANVTKMEERIEKAGFEAYTQKGSRLTKVGIVTGCEEVPAVLEFAKSKFHPDAWVHPIQ